jgi:outer membrane protein OmpA-like peptidoglycan-associated protein
MNKSKYFLDIVVAYAIFFSLAFPQDRSNSYGVGINFGAAIPVTDINEKKDFPFGRAFVRYYPANQVALEAGIGLGTLEASQDNLFFSSVIYPVDMRLLIQPIKEGKFDPYFFGGVGLVYYDPKDRSDQPLPRNANKEYAHMTGYFPIGAGAQYFVTDNTAVGIHGGYNYTLTDNIDDIKDGGKDGFWSVTLDVFAYVKGGNNDLDGDGLLNDEEKQIGTNPLNPDTDGDGLKDGEEVHLYHTNPLKADTDGDGLNDKEEIFTYKTDPLKADTDGDGLTDGDEVHTYHTDPLKMDTDGDGLTDGDEVLKYHTDPLNKDTDGDGLTDGDEVLKYKTDPLKKDTDGDTLTDYDEIFKYKTDPLFMDTDKGGVDDGKEVQLGLNPLDPSDDVPIIKVGERIILEGVNFQTGKTTLLPEAKTILDQVASSLTSYPTAEVAIHGHTDNVGGAKYNMKLSLGRAEAVKAYLVSKGVTASRIASKGFGFVKPIADNATAEGRAKNRRIEFVRLK